MAKHAWWTTLDGLLAGLPEFNPQPQPAPRDEDDEDEDDRAVVLLDRDDGDEEEDRMSGELAQ